MTLGFSHNFASQIVTRTRSNDLYACLPAAIASQSYVPNGLTRDLDKYDGKAVELAGWPDYGLKKRHLIAIDSKRDSIKDRAQEGDCTSVEVPTDSARARPH